MEKPIKIIVLFTFFVLYSCSSFDVVANKNTSVKEVKRIAVFNIKNISQTDGANLAEFIGVEFLRHGYDVVERSILESIIKEQSLSQSGLVDDQTAAKIGKLAGADTVVIGSGKYSNGKLEVLVIKLVSAETSSVLLAAQSEEALSMEEAAKKAVKEIHDYIIRP
ncbi:MAG: CsgG/HfaB family protein [Spirochaetia bacterium]|nr:CsgG/HfaB family protein [Spirochaetia bacterium]